MIRAVRAKVERKAVTQDVDLLTVLAVVTEPLAHCASGKWREVLERSGLRSSGGYDDGIFHSVVLLQGLDKLRYSRALLSDSDVDAVQFLILVLTLVPTLLVKNRVDGNGGLAGLTVTDDELTLTTSDGHHGVNGLNAGHHRLVHRATREDARSLQRSTTTLSSLDGTLAVNRIAESVNNAAEKLRTDRNIDNLAGTLDCVALLDKTVITEDRYTDIVGLQVQAHSTDTGRELHHFLRWLRKNNGSISNGDGLAFEEITPTLHVPETPDASNTVTDAYTKKWSTLKCADFKRADIRTENAAGFFDIATNGRTSYPSLQDGGHLRCS